MNEVMLHQNSRWTKPFLTKVVVIVVILLISLQYLVNVTVFRRNESVIFLKLLDSSVEKILNQTGLVVQQSMRETVTKFKKPQELCPVIPPKLKGHVKVNVQVAAWTFIERENTLLSPGGRYKPSDCQARHRVAVVIPYRDREIHLKIFLENIHPFLQRQQLDYGIFVVEMAAGVKFNRALLMNVGFVEAMKQYDYQCCIFHDVDLLPEDDRNLYTCPQTPRHMSVAIDRLGYKLPYPQIFGGVSAIATEHFKKINGFSNIFFGWGGEDDDMYRRILYSNLTVIRYSPEVARYKMLVHTKEHGNNDRFMLLRTVKARRQTDGLSSLKYHVEKLELRPLYTWILVNVNETEIVDAEPIHKLTYKNLKRNRAQKKPAIVKNVPSNKIAQGKVVLNKDINKGKQAAAIQRVIKQDIDSKPRQVNKNNTVIGSPRKANVKVKAANIPKKPVNAPKQSSQIITKNSVASHKIPTAVSWIPTEFKGILPTNLTKFEPLPIIVPVHMQKKKLVKANQLANRNSAQKQAIIRSQNRLNKRILKVDKSIKKAANGLPQNIQNMKVVSRNNVINVRMNAVEQTDSKNSNNMNNVRMNVVEQTDSKNSNNMNNVRMNAVEQTDSKNSNIMNNVRINAVEQTDSKNSNNMNNVGMNAVEQTDSKNSNNMNNVRMNAVEQTDSKNSNNINNVRINAVDQTDIKNSNNMNNVRMNAVEQTDSKNSNNMNNVRMIAVEQTDSKNSQAISGVQMVDNVHANIPRDASASLDQQIQGTETKR